MKALIFILVLANLLFYAFSQGYFGQADNPDAGRVERQVKAENIRIVARGEGAQAARTVEAAPANEDKPSADSKPPIEDKPQDKPGAEKAGKEAADKSADSAKPKGGESAESADNSPPICVAWEHLTVPEADRLTAAVSDKFSKFKLSRKAVDADVSGWWVYIPPLPGKPEADKKAAELRTLGITDYFAIQDGPNRFAISLGVFSSEKGAQERLAELKAKGVRSAKLTPRPGKDGSITLEARGPGASRKALLAATGEALPKAAVADCK